MKTFSPKTVGQWRQWLADHHESESEVWLVFHKLHTGVASIDYKDALDEALCFGWVDSLVKRLDEDRYARKFTPRRANSRWSNVNRTRYAALKAGGRLKSAGINRAPTERSYEPLPPRFKMPSKVPAHIQKALKKHPVALGHFEALAPSERRRYLAWIESAKQDETKARRLKEAIRLLTAGRVLGLK
ncbi:MAG: YdeI family protein [Gemmatimonadaceae bacterium]